MDTVYPLAPSLMVSLPVLATAPVIQLTPTNDAWLYEFSLPLLTSLTTLTTVTLTRLASTFIPAYAYACPMLIADGL